MSKSNARFVAWIADAEIGDQIMYLQADYAGRNPSLQKLFWDAASEGLVFLHQKRVREGVFNYYAKRISKRAGKSLKPWDIDND